MLKKYENAIEKAIKEANKDSYYTWKVLNFGKDEATFTWSYLNEDRDDAFKLTIEKIDEGESFVAVEIPYSEITCGLLVGNNPWCDADTITKGIELTIKWAVLTAKKIF